MSPKKYKKYDLVKAGDLCHNCGVPFEVYDAIVWMDDEMYKPAHAKCFRKI